MTGYDIFVEDLAVINYQRIRKSEESYQKKNYIPKSEL